MDYLNIFKAIIKDSKQLIFSKEFLEDYRVGNAFTRNRKISFTNVICFLLHSSKKSLPIRLSNFRDSFPSLTFPMVSRQAMSKARQGIRSDAFYKLFQTTVVGFYKRKPDLNTWNGFNVWAIDGTTLQVPDTQENNLYFGSNPNMHTDKGALASASALYDVMNDIIIDVHIKEYRFPERTSAIEHLCVASNLPIHGKTVVVFDRGYPSYEFFQSVAKENYYFLMRVPRHFKQLISLDSSDYVAKFEHSLSKRPYNVRMIQVELDSGETEYLATNIFDYEITCTMFKELYFLRWGVESKYREFKNRFQIEVFSGYKAIVVEQEFYVAMLLSNLCSIMKLQVDTLIQSEKSITNTNFQYQANRSFIINKINNLLIKILTLKRGVLQIIQRILFEATKVKSIIRSNRKFVRRSKKGRRKYNLNEKHCI